MSAAAMPSLAALPRIHDAYADMGPLAGILTALEAHPEAAWLVVSYPSYVSARERGWSAREQIGRVARCAHGR